MKKLFLFLSALFIAFTPLKAETNFAYEAGAEVVSAYIWRGMYNGGLSFQPEALVGFDACKESVRFRIGFWGSIGVSDWKFRKGLPFSEDGSDPNTRFIPEVDFLASISAYGVNMGFTHYYYCDDGSTMTSEIGLGYNFDHFFDVGAYFNWYTMVYGDSTYSSYLEFGYDYTFENIGLTIGGQIGMSPWTSNLYGNEKFTVVNLSIKVDKEFDLGVCTLNLFALGSLNPDGVNKENAYIDASGDDKLYNQKLNGVIGLGVWF